MKKNCLVITPEVNFETEDNRIYLGNWCNTNEYIIKDDNVVPYHWDDREKLERDNKYINNLYEKILNELTLTLNNHHKLEYSNEYWRLVIGYWLFCFLSSTFDKWETISKCFKTFNNIDYIIKYNFGFRDIPIPSTTREYINLSSDIKWNHVIFNEIIEFIKKENKIKIEFKNIDVNDHNFYLNYKINYKNTLGSKLIKVYNFFTSFLTKRNKVIIYKSYTGLKNELRLNLKFKQLPIFINEKNFNNPIDKETRKNLRLNIENNNLYEKFISEIIFNHIPKEFIEDFYDIESHISKLNLPKNPKVILSTTILAKDNIFVRYCAKKKESGTKLIYCQHGGAYGQIKFSWAEDHEIRLSDKYLTWGWKDQNNQKIQNFGILKNINKFKHKKNINKITNISYFLRSRPIFVHRIDSSSGSNQMSKYYNSCLEFFDIKKKLNFSPKIIPRFHEAMFSWNHIEIWKKKLKDLDMRYTYEESLSEVYKNYDLIIYSYIGTGFLESLAVDKPFLVISSLSDWPLREGVNKDFEKLKEANIFFENNESAIKHLNSIIDNPMEWWESEQVKNIKNDFKLKYAYNISNNAKVNKLKKILTEYL